MNKAEYLDTLREKLTETAISNIDSRIEFYSEMIDDRMEDGMTEEEAVASMESIDSIVATSKLEKPITTLVKEKVKESKKKAEKSGHTGLWIVLAIIGFPVWFPLGIVFAAVFFSLYIVLWSMILVFFCVELAFGVTALGCLLGSLIFWGSLNFPTVLCFIGCALVLGSLAFLLWNPILALCKVTIQLFAKCISGCKHLIFK